MMSGAVIDRGKFKNVAIGLLALSLACATMTLGQGFSGFLGSKMEAHLKRRKPPQVYLMGTAISVIGRSQAPEGREHVQPLATQLESALISGDRRLHAEANRPETIIVCTITNLSTSEKWETRTTTESRKVGEQQVWNAKKQKYETKDVYKDVEVTRRYQVVNGMMNVSYQVQDVKTKAALDSANIPSAFSNDYLDGNGAPTSQEVENLLVRNVVARITPRLTPTIEVVKVLLPQGKLKDISRFGESGLWQRMLEAFEKMPALKKPEDDSYRHYGIALANEALAYQAEDLETTKKLLQEASVNYSKAIEMKMEEKYYREPQGRIDTAIAQYQKITEQQAEYAKHLSKKVEAVKKEEVAKQLETPGAPNFQVQPPSTPAPGAPAGARTVTQSKTPTSQTMTNQQVIALVNQGLSEAIILQAIKNALSVQFDTTSQGLIELHKNKVSENVIMAMMARQSAPRKATPATRRKGDQ